MQASFRPLVWPPRPDTRDRRWRPFKASWTNTLNLLDREIGMLRGSALIVAGGWKEHEIRLDGMVRADAREPAHPGVEISFDSRHGRLIYATDVCSHWQDNVRSIALGLEALRAVERFGVAMRGQQYAGFRELPSGIGRGVIISSLDEARLILLDAFGGEHPEPDDPEFGGGTLDEMYRRAVKAAHPDTGGSDEEFLRVRAAYELLRTNVA